MASIALMKGAWKSRAGPPRLVTLQSRSSGGVFVVNDLFTILANTIEVNHEVPLVFAAGTDLELFGDAAANTVDATGGFDLVLLDA